MAQTIKIGVEFFDAQESAKALLDQLRKEVGRFKAGTAISDALVGDIKTLESIIKKLDSSLAKGFNSHGDVNKVVNDFNQITSIYEHVASTIQKTKFQDLNLNFGDFSQLAKDLSQATAELAKFKSQKEQIEQTTIQDLLGKNNKNLSLFSTDQLSTSSITIWNKLTQDLEKYKNSLSDATQKTKELEKIYNDVLSKANTGNQVYKRDNDILSLIGESSKNQADMKTIRGSFIQDIQASLKFDDNKMNLSKAFSVTQKKTLEEWLAPLGLSADSVQNIIATGKSRAEALSEELAKLSYKDISKVRKVVKNSLVQRTLNDEVTRAKRDYESSEKKKLAKEQTVNETEARIKALETPLQQKNYLSTGSNTTLDQKISNLLSRVQALETQLRQKASSGLNAGVNGSGNIPSVSGEPYHNVLNQQAETADLERQGRAMMKRWIGTEAIVNKVRNGIRQAYQDIKSLDAAMTNIAVVTDMSIGDLWDKIDSYMSIAKQYGVTTQGVYEVSQLYYQQGLSTSEVMAATSETLKMARIAGMDYAEAADAMTVAIRAFKMEMSDAQTVTDVYSKVAAITASDSEELAIAMSKTASSAASVGSSFENTTAMLAVMVETTRESAQNLGSALKSIISRYGEMKTGATVDEDGEIIDYNKVDTALKSIGISLKDAQYQFRDFDDVIFELSEKWDSLDKNTQRYIATIMAGNRQQSRFIALVDNWERLDEVATAAQNSEDAGLLQYSKTLDSLETKLNNIKTSFQEFYMSIINGPIITKVLETINSLFEGFNKQGSFAALLDVGSIVSSLTIIGNMFVSIFSGAFGQISANWKAMLQGLSTDAAVAGQKAGDQYRNGATQPRGIGKLGTGLATAASFTGLALTTAGAAVTQKYHNNVGAGMSAVGNALSYGAMGYMLSGNPIVAIVAGALGGITSAISSWRSDLELEQAKLEEATEKAEKSNIIRAEKKTEYETLKREISNLEELEKARFDSAEAQQEWINANNALFEQFPYLAATFDEVGNATIDLEAAEQALAIARQASLQATIKAAEDEKNRAQQDLNVAKKQQEDNYNELLSGKKYENAKGKKVRGYDVAQSYNADFNTKGKNFQAGGSLEAGLYQWLANIGIGEISVNQQGPQGRTYSRNKVVPTSLLSLITRFSETPQDLVFLANNTEYFKQLANLNSKDFLSEIVMYGAKNFKLADGSLKYSSSRDLLADWFHGKSYKDLAIEYQAQIDDYISTVQNSVQTIEGLENKITGADKTLLASKTAEQLRLKEERDEKDYDETYGKIVGWDNYVARYVKEAQAAVEEPFDDKDIEREVEAAVAQWDDLEYTLNDSSNLEEYNSLVESFEKGNISIVDYINSLKNLFNQVIPDAVENTQKWAENEVNKNIKDLAQGLSNKASWKKEGRKNWESETEDISDTEKWLKTIPENLHQNIVDYVNYVNELLTSAKIESSQADSMIEAYTGLYDAINNASFTPEKKAEAFALLDTADLTSLGGIYEYQNALKKAGIEFDSESQVWNNLIQQVLVNIVTETQTFQQKLASTLDADVKLLKQAYDGVDSVVEATELASKLGVTLADFETSGGKIRLKKDIDLKAKREEELAAYKKDLYGEGESWTSGDSAYAKEYRRALEEGSNVESELYKKYQTEFEKWQELPENSNKSLADYIKTRHDSELAAIDSLFTKFWEEQEKLIKKQSIVDSIYGGEAERKKLSAQQSLASGGQGLSGDTIYDILNAYGYDPEKDWQTYFTKNADGTFDIIKDTELFNELDQATKNAILDKIAYDIDSAEQGLQKLGETAATGEKLTPTEIRNLLGAQFDGLSDTSAEFLYTYLKKYINGTSTKDDLTQAIAIILQKQASSKGQNLSIEEAKEQAEKYISEIEAELADAIKTNISKRLELQAKVLQGTATEVEKRALTEAGIDISSLQNKTNEAIIGWINSYITNVDISFDDKVKYAKTAFSTALTNEFGEDIGTLGETAVKGVFGTQDAAADFISKYYTILGQTIDENTADSLVSSWFTRDDSGQYRLKKTIQNLRDELSKIQNSTNQEEIDNLEAQLIYYEDLQELQRKESLTSSLASMVSSTTETTASSLMKMVQDAGGIEIKPEDAEKYAEELKSLDPLKRLQKTVSILSKYDIEINADDYAKLAKAVVSSVMSSAQSAIQSAASGMSWDEAFELQKEIPGLKFEIIDGKLITTEVEKVAEYYRKQLENSINEQRSQLEAIAPQSIVGKATVTSILGLRSKGLTDDKIISSWRETDLIKDALTLLNSDLFNLEDYQSWAANNVDGTLNEYWEQYISTLTGEALEAGKKILEDLTEEANKQAEITNRANALKTEAEAAMGKTYDKLAAEELIKTQGLTGYDETQIATLEQSGIIAKGSAKLDVKTGKYNLTDEHISALNLATQNAVYKSIRNNIRTAAEALNTLGQKMLQGTDTVDDFEAIFGEELSQTDITNLRQDLINLILGKDKGTAKENIKAAFKQAHPEVTDDTIIDSMVTDYVNKTQQELNTLKRTLYETLLTGLESGSLSIENRATVQAYLGQDVLDEFDEAISENANKRAQRILVLQGKIIASQLERGDITLTSYYETRASQATQAFNEIYGDNLVNIKHQLSSTISSGDATFDGEQIGKLFALVEESLVNNLEQGQDAFTVFGERYIKGLTETGEYLLDVNALRADNIISQDQFSEYQRSIVEKAFSSAEDLMSKAISGDKIGIDELQTTFSELGWNLSDSNAKAIIERGANTILSNIEFALLNQGITPADYSDRLKELQTLVMDALMESITGSLSAFESGMQGTLSETEYQKYAAQYGLSGSARTARGRQLSGADAQKWLTGEYQRAKANKLDDTFGEDVWKIYSSTAKDGIDGYRDIEVEIQRVKDTQDTNNDAVKEYIELLEKARDAAMLSADSKEFAFMDQDATGGLAKNFDTFAGSIEKVKTAFNTLQSGGKVEFNDFYNIMDFIKNSESAFNTFHKATGIAKDDYDTLVNTIISKTEDWNQIDIKGIAAEMGISVEAAMGVMKDSMTDGLKEVAQQQIKYLSGLEAMLKAMAALEELGSIDLSLSFMGDNGVMIETRLSEILDIWTTLSEAEQQELIVAIETKFTGPGGIDSTKAAKEFTEAIGFTGDLSTFLFGKDGINEQIDLQIADAFGTLLDSNLTEGQWTALGEQFSSQLSSYFIFDENTKLTTFKDGFSAALLAALTSIDISNVPDSINTKIQAEMANKKIGSVIEIDSDTKLVLGNNGRFTLEGSDTDWTKAAEAIKVKLKELLGIDIGEIIKNDDGSLTFTGLQNTDATGTLITQFKSLEDAAKAVQTVIQNLQEAINSLAETNVIMQATDYLNGYVSKGTVSNSEDIEDSENLNIEIADGNSQEVLDNINSNIEDFKAEVEKNPITIPVSTSNPLLAASGQTTIENTPAAAPTIIKKSTVIQQVAQDLPPQTLRIIPEVDEIPEQEDQVVGYKFKQNGSGIQVPSDVKKVPFVWTPQKTLQEMIPTTPLIVPVIYKPTNFVPTQLWTGNVNNISGNAWVEGNISDPTVLANLSRLTDKTLVGELGPELAVYNHQYHLLGQNGAEFINLPKDAIVFNHKQTEGIIKGQTNIRGSAMAEGNISGPALAGGASAALAAVQRAKAMWQGLLNSLTVADLLGGGAGGGGGNTLKGVKEELQEWYNLSRQIADIEQEINNLVAERQNIAEKNGDAYLRSLRKEQELLEQQAATQKILLGYQQLQLDRQAEQINTNKIWSQFLEVDESGLLQYIKGNELNGGKGALEVLSELNEMSGEEQLKFLNNLGYTAVDQDGEKLEGQELIQKFFEELQLQIDEYDALYDTVHETEETLEDLQHKVQEINDQIIENQMDLEQDIFDILVDAWEEEIDTLEEQKDLIEEANDAYIKGLNEALSAEREMYSEEQSIADREQLQRQLSLLRRSGGSASQIADLEQQLDSMLKDEYFRNQEQVIEHIEDANEEQIRQLERQIRLQEEALEFEKENGILWTKVYDIMSGSADQILNFMQGNSPEFFSQSLLQQEKMLTEWAKKIGIYTENKKYEGYEQDIQQSAWDSGDIWSYDAMSNYKNTYDSMTSEQQAAARNMFNTTYANARLAGDDHNTAIAKAQNALINNFKSYKEQQAASSNKPETDLYTGSGSQIWYVTGPNKLNLRDQPSKSGNRLAQLSAGTKVKVIKKLDNGWFQVEVNGKTGYVDSQFLSKETSSSSSGNSNNSQSSNSSSSSSGKQYKANYTITYQNKSTGEVKTYTGTGIGNTEAAAIKTANEWLKRRRNGERPSAFPSSEWDEMASRAATKAYAYAQGGLVNYTGIAMVHGSSSKPEAFLNAKQTAMISEAVKVAGDGGALDGIRTTLNKLDATIKSIINNNKNETTSFTVAPGAVTIQVAQLNDSYDVEELSKDVMNRMVAIASKSTNRGVNRR